MLKNIDVSSALRRVAERKIEEAMRDGKFDHLEGAGKPIELEPMPADETARLMWWALRILRRNDVVPDEVKYRKAIATLQTKLSKASTEAGVRAAAEEINGLVLKLNTMGTNAIPSDAVKLDVDVEVARWRAAQPASKR